MRVASYALGCATFLATYLTAVPGPAAPRTVDTRLGEADLVVKGIDLEDDSGTSVILADLDGDGFDDVVTGAPLADSIGNSRSKAGEAYVQYGSPTLSGTLDLASIPPDSTIFGGPAGDHFGEALAAGDLNGDGFVDLIIGAPRGHGPLLDRPESGQVYVFFGGARFPAQWDVAAVPADVTAFGFGPSSGFGQTILAVDFDGDVFDDMVVGAPTDNTGGRFGGKVYSFRGRASWPSSIDLLSGGSERVFVTNEGNALLGTALAAADIDQDGIADLGLSALSLNHPTAPERGEAHVFYSSQPRGALVDVQVDPGDWLVLGGEAGGRLGFSIALGDFDGDGIADLGAGAPEANPDASRPRGGKVYVLKGNGALGRVTDLAVDAPDLVVLGKTDRGRFGRSMCSADFDRDGIADLVVGAPLETPDPSREFAGVGRVLLGAAGLPLQIDLALDDAELAVLGRTYKGALAWSVGRGDVDGDGATDVIFGAPLTPEIGDPRQNAGESYVVRGTAPTCATFEELKQTIASASVDVEGVRGSLEAKASAAEGAFGRGHVRTSGNVLCALVRECLAQDGKQIATASAILLRRCALGVGEALGIPMKCSELGEASILQMTHKGGSLRTRLDPGAGPWSLMKSDAVLGTWEEAASSTDPDAVLPEGSAPLEFFTAEY